VFQFLTSIVYFLRRLPRLPGDRYFFLSGTGESVVPLDFEVMTRLVALPFCSHPCLATISAMDGAQVPVAFFEVANVSQMQHMNYEAF
jgi:hypothetical protein